MTAKQASQMFIKTLTYEERVIYEERVGAMCGTGEITAEAHQCAVDDVEKFQAREEGV